MTTSYPHTLSAGTTWGAVLLIVLSGTCLAQSSEPEQILFDKNLQPVTLQEYVEPKPNLNVMNQDGAPRWYSMFTKLPGDWARSGSLLFRSETVPAAVGVGLLTFSFVRMDNQMWRATRRFYKSSQTATQVSNYAVALGDGRLHLGIAGAFAGYGWLVDDPTALRTASQTVEAFLATGITVQLLKRVTGRQSPAAATHLTGRWKFLPHMEQYAKHPTSYYAFPSGHMSTAMATLTVVAENYPDQHWLKPVGYTLVGALGTALVAKGMHWYSDLPLGIALGYVFGKIAATPLTPGLQTASQSEEGVKVVVSPELDAQGGAGIHFALAF